jgi:integrase
MSLYQREGTPYWQYDFTVNGTRFRGSTGRIAKREASVRERELRHDAENRPQYANDWTIASMLSVYWNEHAKHKTSARTTLAIIENLTKGLGGIKMMALENPMLMDYRAKRRSKKVIAQTVNRDIATLQAAMNHAKSIHGQHVPQIAWKSLKVPENPHRIRFLARSEFDRLMQEANVSIRPIIAFAVFTGLRKENITSLDWSQVDLGSGWVTVLLKGNKRHTIRLSAPAKAVLSVMQDRRGKVFDTTNFRKRWYAAINDAEIADFRFHDLRHTFASWARQAGADLADICDALGHSNIAVTMKYAHIKSDTQITAFDRLAEAFTSHSASQSIKIAG